MNQLIVFLRRPAYVVDDNPSLGHKRSLLFFLLALSLVISMVLALFIGLLESNTPLDLGRHAMDDFLDAFHPGLVFLVAVLLAPVLEEFLFRGPLIFFRGSAYFGVLFYGITLVFALYHLTNFELNKDMWLFSPLLVAPQFCVGLILGFIRVRLGLLWAILLHALYNLILIGPVLLLKSLDFPIG